MENVEAFRERFSESGWRIVEHAMNEARRRGQNYVSLEHLIAALAAVEPDLFDAVMLDLDVDASEVRGLLERRVECGLRHRGEGVRLAPEVSAYLKRAWQRSRWFKRTAISSGHILLALAEDRRGWFVELLRSFGADADRIAWAVLSRAMLATVARISDTEMAACVPLAEPSPKAAYRAGDTVRVKSGPFASFTGKVVEVLKEAARLKVVVEIFGRPAAIELSFRDAEKLTFS